MRLRYVSMTLQGFFVGLPSESFQRFTNSASRQSFMLSEMCCLYFLMNNAITKECCNSPQHDQCIDMHCKSYLAGMRFHSYQDVHNILVA
jgi:hypothetical protein